MELVLGNPFFDQGHTRLAVETLANPIRAMCIFHLLQDCPPRESRPMFTLEEIRDYYVRSDPEKYK